MSLPKLRENLAAADQILQQHRTPLTLTTAELDQLRGLVMAARLNTCTGVWDTCMADDGECMECSRRDCPHGSPLHYHHDSCGACAEAEDAHG